MIATFGKPHCHRRRAARLALALLSTTGLIGLPVNSSVSAQSQGPVTMVDCALAGARLDFGNINPRRKFDIASVGEVAAICVNHSNVIRAIEVTLAFPDMGAQDMPLQAGDDSPVVTLCRDAQCLLRWGDDRNGGVALHLVLELLPREQRRLRFPVYARLHAKQESGAGLYKKQIPVTLSVRAN